MITNKCTHFDNEQYNENISQIVGLLLHCVLSALIANVCLRSYNSNVCLSGVRNITIAVAVACTNMRENECGRPSTAVYASQHSMYSCVLNNCFWKRSISSYDGTLCSYILFAINTAQYDFTICNFLINELKIISSRLVVLYELTQEFN